MAEILIRAYNSWMEAVPQATKDKWSVAMWAKYNRRRRKGNPIVIKSNGWKWGKKECLPRYVILRVDMSMEEAKKYVEKGYEDKDETQITKYNRKYSFDVNELNVAVLTETPILTKSKFEFEEKIIDLTEPRIIL